MIQSSRVYTVFYNLLHGKIDLFSVGMLLDMMKRAGFQIYKKIQTNTSRMYNHAHAGHHHTVVVGAGISVLTNLNHAQIRFFNLNHAEIRNFDLNSSIIHINT